VGGQACVVLDERPGRAACLPGDGNSDMKSASLTQIMTSPATTLERPRRRLRLKLKPQPSATGYVDGGWWPRSRDLAAELPGLLAVLTVRLGPIERVSYHLTTWGPAARKIHLGGVAVRLAGDRSRNPDTVDVLGARDDTGAQPRITLLVVPPDTPAQAAHRALMAAGRRGNTERIDELLIAALPASADGGAAPRT
jgi:uncharacterized protein DUF5994